MRAWLRGPRRNDLDRVTHIALGWLKGEHKAPAGDTGN